MQIKAISFDAAGTLLHAHPSVGHVYAEVVGRYGPKVDPQTMEDAFRRAFTERRALTPGAETNLKIPGNDRYREVPHSPGPLEREGYDWWKTLVFDVLKSLEVSVGRPDDFFHELYWRFADPEVWRLFPDAMPALLEARGRGLKIALVSNWDVRLRRLSEGLGLAPLFEALIISSEVGVEKPDPRIYRIACERLGIAPCDALHIGDNRREDIAGARAAGMRALLIDRKSAADAPSWVVRDLRQWHVTRKS